jgi:hypothetical protein
MDTIPLSNPTPQGPDNAHYHIHTNVDDTIDEIDNYWNACYLSLGEGAWCMMGFNITKKEPSIMSLSVHLP